MRMHWRPPWGSPLKFLYDYAAEYFETRCHGHCLPASTAHFRILTATYGLSPAHIDPVFTPADPVRGQDPFDGVLFYGAHRQRSTRLEIRCTTESQRHPVRCGQRGGQPGIVLRAEGVYCGGP